MAFEQFAQDTLKIEVEGPYHCGPDHTSPKHFKYEVTIEYPDSALDANGFVLDNLTFRQFFDRCQRTSLSCELFTTDCAKKLMELTGGKANVVKVRLWAIQDHVCITKIYTRADWLAEQDRAAFAAE